MNRRKTILLALLGSLLLLYDGGAQERGLREEQRRFESVRGDVFAVVVGIADYGFAGIRDLKYADGDARAFAEFLKSERGGRVPTENIRLLVNEQATLVNVRSALLDWLPPRANKKDRTAVVFFAGHGVLYLDDPLFLVRDTEPDKLGGSGLPMDVVQKAFDKLEAERKLFFADACHSGAISGGGLASRGFSGNLLLDRLAGKGRAVITSSRDDQSSYESDALRAGFFTHYLLEGLNGEADRDADGYVTLTEAYEYTYNAVADAASRHSLLQNPRMKAEIDGQVLLSRVGRSAEEWQALARQRDARIARLQRQIAEQEARLARERADRLEKAAYDRAAAAGTIEALEGFLSAYPQGRYAGVARDRIEQMRLAEEQRAFERAKRTGTARALEDFLDRYPNSSYGQEARNLIREILEREAEARKQAAEQARLEAERKAQEEARLLQRLEALKRQEEGPAPGTPALREAGDMVLIPAGEFRMGSNNGDNDEKPVHTVYVDGFYMDKYEVTVAAFTKFRPSYRPHFLGCDNCPAETVSWEDAKAYCEWAGKRLPTEAEWEKACRGGLEGKEYPWGEGIDPGKANSGGRKGRTVEVGSYAPNRYGLYDMSGNVWEWVSDWYDGNYYGRSPSRNPENNNQNRYGYRVIRGGSWLGLLDYPLYYVRCADRHGFTPGSRNNSQGFRCAR